VRDAGNATPPGRRSEGQQAGGGRSGEGHGHARSHAPDPVGVLVETAVQVPEVVRSPDPAANHEARAPDRAEGRAHQ